MSDFLTANLTQAQQIIRASIDADTPIHMIGAPGIGKSSIARALGASLGLPVETLILSQCDVADVGGIPVPDSATGSVVRFPLGAIKRACEVASIVFLDEFLNAHPALQGASLSLILERFAGDVKLHPGSRILLASNPVDQGAGAHDATLPAIGRMTTIHVRPTLAEVQAFFYSLGAPDSPLRALAVDLAATWEHDVKLLQIDPPRNTSKAGGQWGAPRNWERALRLVSALTSAGFDETSENVALALQGSVGADIGLSWLALRKIRKDLPSISTIEADPLKALVPRSLEMGIASLGLLGQVARTQPASAWIWANRIDEHTKGDGAEIKMAALRVLNSAGATFTGNAKFADEAKKARQALIHMGSKAL